MFLLFFSFDDAFGEQFVELLDGGGEDVDFDGAELEVHLGEHIRFVDGVLLESYLHEFDVGLVADCVLSKDAGFGSVGGGVVEKDEVHVVDLHLDEEVGVAKVEIYLDAGEGEVESESCCLGDLECCFLEVAVEFQPHVVLVEFTLLFNVR